MQNPTKPTAVSFGLKDQTVDALELTLESLCRVPDRPAAWKRVILGIHDALHGSFGLVLERTDGAQLLIPDQEQQYWARVARERATGKRETPVYTTTKGKLQDEKVDWFLDLFTKTQDPNRMRYLAGVPLRPTPVQKESVEWINWYRGHLIHFGRTTLVIEVCDVLRDVENALDIIETLLFRTRHMAPGVWGGPIDTVVEYEQSSRARQLIGSIRAELAAVRERYDLNLPETR